jgi:hypothetical protein
VTVSFLNPALLWGLAAAAIPLLVHLFFRRRPRPTPFPAIDFVLQARKETQRRLRLRKVLLFAARTALLAAAALAIARPRWVSPEAQAAQGPAGPAAVAIVLDTSASMSYRLGGRTLLERARQDALDALAGLGSEEPATVVICGGPAVPEAEPPGFDRAEARRRLRDAEPTHGHADLTSCVGAAVRGLAESAAGQAMRRKLFVATDLTASAWRLDGPAPVVATPGGPMRPEVTLLDAARGEELPNAWISGLTAEPDPAVGPRGYRVAFTVSGRAGEPEKDAPLVLRVGHGREERTAVRAFVEIPAAGTARKTLSHDFASGGPAVLSAALPGDALPGDDALAIVLEVPRQVRALVVDGAPSPVKHRDEAFFLEAALSGPSSPVRPSVVDVEGLGKVALADFDVVFLLNVRSLGTRAQEMVQFVEKGGGLFVAMGDEVDPDRYDAEMKALLPSPLHVVKTAAERGSPGAMARAARFAEVDWEHPALQVFTGSAREGVDAVRTFRYMLLRPERKGDGGRVVMRYDDGAPALVEVRRGQGRVMLYTSTLDREWSDWTIRTSFLPAMQRVAAYLAGALEERRDWPTPVFAPRVIATSGAAVAAASAPAARAAVPDEAVAAGTPGPATRGTGAQAARVPAPAAAPEKASVPWTEGDVRVVAVVGPDGRERRVGPPEAGKGNAVSVTPDVPGLWQVKVAEAGKERLDPRLAFAVWPDPRESDTRRLEASELTAWFGGASHAKVAGERSAGEGRQVPLWSWLLLVALAAFLAEGALVS